ncbi:MAG: hypothetical protein EP301_08635 [Gammaproteobacteria bacterium]|jgi:hypothetical protein|nr:MAG: hypothetical protein EP301_08635 [Gammaproteobacteria bacterium]
MSDLISTDHPLTERERRVLTALLDTLIPASEDLEMPSAAQVDFDAYLKQQGADLIPALQQALDHFGTNFGDLPLDARIEAVSAFSTDQPELFMALLSRVYDCYYQDDLVREKIGVISGAPFPQGNEVMPGDLSLLDPVIEHRDNHRFRET